VNRIQRAIVAAAAGILWASIGGAQSATPDPGPRLERSSSSVAIPDGIQWTGLLCNRTSGCSCPRDASRSFRTAYCTAGGRIPFGKPLFTLTWGIGQVDNGDEMTGSPSLLDTRPIAMTPARSAGAVAWTPPG
jgi:hypothetical protein